MSRPCRVIYETVICEKLLSCPFTKVFNHTVSKKIENGLRALFMTDIYSNLTSIFRMLTWIKKCDIINMILHWWHVFVILWRWQVKHWRRRKWLWWRWWRWWSWFPPVHTIRAMRLRANERKQLYIVSRKLQIIV